MDLKREPIIEQCKGCRKIQGYFCSAYLVPAAKWRLGQCNLNPKKEEFGKEERRIRKGLQKQRSGLPQTNYNWRKGKVGRKK